MQSDHTAMLTDAGTAFADDASQSALTLPDVGLPGAALELHDEAEPMERPHPAVLVTTALFVVVPFLALIGGVMLLWGTGVGWAYLIPLFVGYVLTGLGITIGYHRLFTHKSFDASPVVRATFGILGSMAAEGPLNWWVATHRRHHQHSDRHDDPHSPHHGEHSGVWGLIKGAVHAHFGWLFAKRPTDLSRLVPDLDKDKVARFVTATFPLWVGLGLLIPAGLGWLVSGSWVGALLGLLWGGVVRIFVVHHVTWSVNSICHLWGARPFRVADHSRNNPIVGVLAFGEGWHNNHHAFPASARHGLAWWQVDTSYIVIRALSMVGLVSNVRTPPRDRIEAKRKSLRGE